MQPLPDLPSGEIQTIGPFGDQYSDALFRRISRAQAAMGFLYTLNLVQGSDSDLDVPESRTVLSRGGRSTLSQTSLD